MSEGKVLKSIVPPPELCKLIPAGKFEGSALVWTPGVDGMFIDFRDARPEDEEGNLPAPTLAEILDELSKTYTLIDAIQQVDGEWHVSGWKTPVKLDKNPTTAALRLWLEVAEVK